MAVKALLHYALEVPDQGAGEKFYSNFGLVNAPSRDNAVRLKPAPLQRAAVLLYGGAKKRLHHLAFGAPNAVRLKPAPLQRAAVLLYGGAQKRLHHLAFGAPGE